MSKHYGKYQVGCIEDYYEWREGKDNRVREFIEASELTNPFLYSPEHWNIINDAFIAGMEHVRRNEQKG